MYAEKHIWAIMYACCNAHIPSNCLLLCLLINVQ